VTISRAQTKRKNFQLGSGTNHLTYFNRPTKAKSTAEHISSINSYNLGLTCEISSVG